MNNNILRECVALVASIIAGAVIATGNAASWSISAGAGNHVPLGRTWVSVSGLVYLAWLGRSPWWRAGHRTGVDQRLPF